MRGNNPLAWLSGKAMMVLFLLSGLAIVCFGIYIGVFQSRGYEKTTAVITDLEEELDEELDEEMESIVYIPTVTYTVDGREYTQELDTRLQNAQLGKEVKIKYDPADPTKIHEDAPGLVICLIVFGMVLVILSLFNLLKRQIQRMVLYRRQT